MCTLTYFCVGCSSIVATSVTQNVDQVFPAGNRYGLIDGPQKFTILQ